MAQETEPVAASESTLESTPSPKRCNRKKGRRGSTASDDDNGHDEEQDAAFVSPMGDVATGDLISLPSPVAAVPTRDVFAETTTAMGDLALDVETQETSKQQKQEDNGLLKLPIHPSSGRLPWTPPPTPEPFMMHSPEKEQARVVPISPHVQQLLASTAEQEKGEAAPMGDMTEDDAVVEHETSVLSSTLADMNLSNGSGLANVSEEPEMPVEKPETALVASEVVVDEEHQATVADDHVASPTANVEVFSMSAIPTEDTSEVTVAVPCLVPKPVTTVLPTTVETPLTVVAEPARAQTPKATKPAQVDIPVAVEPTQADTVEPTEEAVPVPPKEGSKTFPESSQLPRRNKRKGDSSEQIPHTTPVVTSRLFAKTYPSTAASAPTNGESTGSSKQATLKDSSSEPLLQPRPAKRKGDTSDAKPPPAPSTAVTKEIRPKRLVVRRSTLNNVKADPEAKPKLVVAARPVQDQKKDAMMNPTASSMARATAAEARKALLKTAAAKKAPVRKPMRAKFQSKSAMPAPSAPTDQDKSTLAPPAPAAVDDGDDGQRNVKRRLNATDVEAASKRLYEDAKEAKARKDARRAELQETYTFAPQVNNFKRRSAPGQTEDPNQDHFSRLHAHAKEMQEKKRELQQNHERDGCTFAPTISARAKRLAQPSTGPRYENLYKHAQEMKQKREEKLLERAKTTEEQCPFKPKITAVKSPVKRTKPLYDSERDKQKRLALEQKKIEVEVSKCTFKPKVSAKRMKSKTEGPSDSTTNAATDANPYNRLYQASIDRMERLQKLRQERDEEEKAQAPFQPKITARSRMLKAKAKTKEPFHKRLYNKDYMKRLDTEREQRRLEEEQQFTFKPEINEPPEGIKAKVNERASPQKSIFERLYDEKDKVKEKIEMGQELRLQKEMAECTFRPHIEVDGGQSNGGPAPPVWERLLSYDKAHMIEEREKLKEQLEMQECTFKPEVKSPDAHMMKGSPSFNVFDRLTGSGSNSPLDPTRASFITRRTSPGRQSPDAKGVSIVRVIKLTKFSLPTEKKKLSRAYSISQPSSVNKPAMKRSTSFSGPKSATSSPTMSTATVLSSLVRGSHQAETSITPDRDDILPQSVTENYASWSAELDAKLRQL